LPPPSLHCWIPLSLPTVRASISAAFPRSSHYVRPQSPRLRAPRRARRARRTLTPARSSSLRTRAWLVPCVGSRQR
jgi:hypothetical protein